MKPISPWITNERCSICLGKNPPPFDQEHPDIEGLISSFVIGSGIDLYTELTAVLHSRNKQTPAMVIQMLLYGTPEQGTPLPDRVAIYSFSLPKEWNDPPRERRTLLGCMKTIRPFERNDDHLYRVIQPGTFLVFGGPREGISFHAQLPVAHLIQRRVRMNDA